MNEIRIITWFICDLDSIVCRQSCSRLKHLCALWLQTPCCTTDTDLLEEAMEVFCRFLTWPEPYCSVCRKLLSTLQLEMKAPGNYREKHLFFSGLSLLYMSVYSMSLYCYVASRLSNCWICTPPSDNLKKCI